MESQYLQSSVGPVLKQAIGNLLAHRIHTKGHPQDPIDFIAFYLHNHAKTLAAFGCEDEEDARIKGIKDRFEREQETLKNHLRTVRASVVEAVNARQERLQREEEAKKAEIELLAKQLIAEETQMDGALAEIPAQVDVDGQTFESPVAQESIPEHAQQVEEKEMVESFPNEHE